MKQLIIQKLALITVICIFIYNMNAFSDMAVTYKKEPMRNCSRYTGLGNRTSDPLFCKRMQIVFTCTYDQNTYALRIIVIVFNRSRSLLRLLNSLNEAIYDEDKVKLEVWIDRSVHGSLDKATVETASTFSFKHGVYEVIPHVEHVGIMGQWLSTWRPGKNSSEIAVILEDDITISKYFYKYLKIVHEKYDHYQNINGYALQGFSMKHHIKDTSPLVGPNGSLVFLYPVIGTWGFSPSRDNWIAFQKWYISVCRNETIEYYIPNSIVSRWHNGFKKKRMHNNIWGFWHVYHAYINFEHTLYTNLPGHVGFSTNWREKGLHFRDFKGKTNELLQDWVQSFENLPSKPTVVDISGRIVN